MLNSLFCGVLLAASVLTAGATAAGPPASSASSDRAAIEAYRRLPYCRLAPDGKRLAEEPCRRPPTRRFAERRAVPALPGQPPAAPRPPVLAPDDTWRPTLASPDVKASPANPSNPSAPVAALPPPSPGAVAPPVAPPAVQPLNHCGIAGCRGANGTLYQQGAGNIVLDPAGRLCTRHGDWVHCQ